MIFRATIEDLDKIMRMIHAVVKQMNEQGSKQWDESYPTEADYNRDISRDELFIYKEDGNVYGVCTISKRGHQEYDEINWSIDIPTWTLKRMAIHPEKQGCGIADQLVRHAEKIARQAGIFALNTDTFSDNQYAKKLFHRHEFKFVEKRSDPRSGEKLNYYEKSLEERE